MMFGRFTLTKYLLIVLLFACTDANKQILNDKWFVSSIEYDEDQINIGDAESMLSTQLSGKLDETMKPTFLHINEDSIFLLNKEGERLLSDSYVIISIKNEVERIKIAGKYQGELYRIGSNHYLNVKGATYHLKECE